ncbi:MAG: hypothetical protein LBU76_04340 [Azoarcus sp.]|nr:hypothetical protein [Azoarcus sp.]
MQHPLFRPSRLVSSFALFAMFSAFSPASMALQPLITDDTGTQGSGGHQLEFSYSHDRTRSDGAVERADFVPATYTYGLAETLDIYGGVAYGRIRASGESASGFSNAVFGLKWRFFDSGDSGTSLALKPEVVLPVSQQREEEGFGVGKTSGALTIILSQDVSFGSVHFNAGMGRDRCRHPENDSTNRHFSVAPIWDISERWKLALDVGFDQYRSNGETSRAKYGEIGVIFAPAENLELAAGFIRTLGSGNPKPTTSSVVAGVTWRF